MPFARCIAAGYVLFCVPKENQKGRRCPQGMKAPVGLLSRRPVCKANAACSARQGLRYFRGAGGGGLRLPASASCLARHSHPAGRCSNSSSLFPPLAAVVAVAHFSHFSDLRLRRGCYVSAGLYVQQRRKVCCEAANRRRAKMRLRDLRANARISSIFAWSPLLRNC